MGTNKAVQNHEWHISEVRGDILLLRTYIRNYVIVTITNECYIVVVTF